MCPIITITISSPWPWGARSSHSVPTQVGALLFPSPWIPLLFAPSLISLLYQITFLSPLSNLPCHTMPPLANNGRCVSQDLFSTCSFSSLHYLFLSNRPKLSKSEITGGAQRCVAQYKVRWSVTTNTSSGANAGEREEESFSALDPQWFGRMLAAAPSIRLPFVSPPTSPSSARITGFKWSNESGKRHCAILPQNLLLVPQQLSCRHLSTNTFYPPSSWFPFSNEQAGTGMPRTSPIGLPQPVQPAWEGLGRRVAAGGSGREVEACAAAAALCKLPDRQGNQTKQMTTSPLNSDIRQWHARIQKHWYFELHIQSCWWTCFFTIFIASGAKSFKQLPIFNYRYPQFVKLNRVIQIIACTFLTIIQDFVDLAQNFYLIGECDKPKRINL